MTLWFYQNQNQLYHIPNTIQNMRFIKAIEKIDEDFVNIIFSTFQEQIVKTRMHFLYKIFPKS